MEKLINAFLNNLKRGDYSINTLDAYSVDLYQFLAFLNEYFDDPVRLSDLCPKVIKEYWEYLDGLNYKSKTMLRKSSSLKTFIKYLDEENKVIQGNFHESIDWPIACTSDLNEDVNCISQHELNKVMTIMKNTDNPRAIRDFAIISILLETGIGISDLIELNMCNWDEEKGILLLSTGDDRVFYLPQKVTRNSIKEYLKFGRPELTQDPKEAALFVSQWGTRISRQGVWQMLKKWGDSADIHTKLTPRTIRNSAVQKMILQGKTACEIQSLVGHKNSFSTRYLMQRFSTQKNIDEGKLHE